MYVSKSERKLQQLQESRRKIYGQQASITANGKEDSDIYRSLAAELTTIEI